MTPSTSVGLGDLLAGLPEEFHPSVRAVWAYARGRRDVAQMTKAIDTTLVAIMRRLENGEPYTPDWKIDNQAWQRVQNDLFVWVDRRPSERSKRPTMRSVNVPRFFMHMRTARPDIAIEKMINLRALMIARKGVI